MYRNRYGRPGSFRGEPTVATSDIETLTSTNARRFPAAPTSVGQARRFLLAAVPDASPDETDELVLLLSELATNAVQHAASEFEVAVGVAPDGRSVRVEVSDEADGYPTPQEQVPDAPRGRGLHIVRTLADAWGIEARRDRPGKTVWFTMPLSGADVVPSDGHEEPVQRDEGRVDDGGGLPAGAAVPAAAPAGAAAPARAPAAGAGTGGEQAWPVPGVRVVLDGLRDAVVATDEQGVIRYVNKAAEDLLGWPHGSLVGRSVYDLVPDSVTTGDGSRTTARSSARRPRTSSGADSTPSSNAPTGRTSTRSWSSASSTTPSPARLS